jgi:DNA polymerase I-like protein with 3'-5' exonuclease and polymerase domains
MENMALTLNSKGVCMYIYLDIETNGYLEDTTTVHCYVLKYGDSLTRHNHKNNTIESGLRFLMESTEPIVAHNGIKFDIPALTQVYPWFSIDEDRVHDTLVMSRLMYTNLFDTDPKLIVAGQLPPKLTGRHSLEAWGHRVGVHKISYEGGFEVWSEEMEDYCAGDVETLEAVHKKFLSINYSKQALELEHRVAHIIARQERRGFTFDVTAAVNLYAQLSKERTKIEADLRTLFKPFYVRKAPVFTPKADNKRYGYIAQAELTPLALTEFNPGSRDHISNRLISLRGWTPLEFTNDGKPKVDETVLSQLVYPEAKVLSRYLMLNKRIGQLAEGDQAWLKVERNGVIHGGVNTNGAVTGRMTHSNPNLAQVPAVYSAYGLECRSLFKPRKGMVLVGADAAALELRCLAAYMAPFDDGAYIKTVVDGKKEDGTEIHTVNRKALGIESRDVAKTWFYAFIYGAGNDKLGTTLGFPTGSKAQAAGKDSREKFFKGLPALATLVERVQLRITKTKSKWVNGVRVETPNPKYVGYLKGLDGRILHCRSSHAALNTLLQSAGAVIMKQSLVCLEDSLKEKFTYGIDYAFVVNVHDEFQLEVRPELADEVGRMCTQSMIDAGNHFNFACPITGEYKHGNSWSATH